MRTPNPLVRHLVTSALLTLSLGLASCSGGGGAPSPPKSDFNAPTPNFVGTWFVRTQFTSASANCGAVVGQIVDGQLLITKTGTKYTVSDGSVTRPMTVRGNTGSFSYSALGVTQVWTFVVYRADTLMHGAVDIKHSQCTAAMSVTGHRTAPTRITNDPMTDSHASLTYDIVAAADYPEGGGGGLRVIVVKPAPTPTAEYGVIDTITTELLPK